MKKFKIILGTVALLNSAGICQAGNEKAHIGSHSSDIWRRESLTDGFFGINERLSGGGMEIGLGVTNIYQHNVRGGISTHRRAGRFSGSYDLEASTDLQKLLGIRGGRLFIHTEGWWSKSEGIDAPSIGSVFGVNGDAMPRNTTVITELWYEQSLFDGSFLLRIGKMDLITGGFECGGFPVAFDRSAFANDETSQFLNGALVNNPTIPFPVYALGVSAFYKPIDWLYAATGVLDAQNDFRETGFRTAFGDKAYFFYVFETGILPQFNFGNGSLQGAYRVGFWNDPQPKAHSDDKGKYRDDVGFYLSCDQMLTKENADSEDNQGLGSFFRYGYAGSKRNDNANFWSVGFQYQGIIECRDDDVFGVGFAHGVFSNRYLHPDDYESAIELYYNAKISPWLNLSPSLQYIANPGGAIGVSDAVVFGLRQQMRF